VFMSRQQEVLVARKENGLCSFLVNRVRYLLERRMVCVHGLSTGC
jgi:hypothetical protein